MMVASDNRQLRRFDEPEIWRVFSRRGTIQILLALSRRDAMRSRDIDAEFPSIARQVLGTRLNELRELGAVQRRVFDGPPMTSEYNLTDLGREISVAANVLENAARKSGELEANAA